MQPESVITGHSSADEDGEESELSTPAHATPSASETTVTMVEEDEDADKGAAAVEQARLQKKAELEEEIARFEQDPEQCDEATNRYSREYFCAVGDYEKLFHATVCPLDAQKLINLGVCRSMPITKFEYKPKWYPTKPKTYRKKNCLQSKKGGGGKGSNSKITDDSDPSTKPFVESNVQLHKAEIPWKAENLEDLEEEEAKQKKLLRNVRGLLNKITPTTKDALIDEFLSYKVYDTPSLNDVINLIFNMAVEGTKYRPLYSSLCVSQVQEELEITSSFSLFRNAILKYTHQIFFNKTLDDLVSEKEEEIEAEEDEKKKKEKQIELMEAQNRFRRRKFGIILFIGQLFIQKLLNLNIIQFSILDLLPKNESESIDEESIDCAIRLMETIGKRLNDDLVASQNAAAAAATPQKKQLLMDRTFQMLESIQSQVSSRINLMILSLVELRENNWIPRMTVDGGPKKINEIKKDMKKVQQQKKMLREVCMNGRGMRGYAKSQLHKAKNPWKAENLDDRETEYAKKKKLLRSLRGLLNKITPTTKDALIDEFLSYKVYETPALDDLINMIFDMAVAGPKYCPLYSSLCMIQVQVELSHSNNISLFRNAILKCAQQTFTTETQDDFVAAKEAKIEAEKNDEKKKRKQIELMEAQNRFRRKKFGNIQFMGQLYLQNLINHNMIHSCVVHLLQMKNGKPVDEKSIGCAVKLMETIGKQLNEVSQNGDHKGHSPVRMCSEVPYSVDVFLKQFPMEWTFRMLDSIQCTVNSRIRRQILNLVELRKNNWIPSTTKDDGPKKLSEIKEEIEKEQLANEQHEVMLQQPWRNGCRKEERRGKRGMVTDYFSKHQQKQFYQQERETTHHAPHDSIESSENIQLHKAKNPWKAENLEDLEEWEATKKKLLRNVRGLLNKITPTTKDALIDEFLSYKVYETPSLGDVSNLIFNRSVEGPKYLPLYSNICASQVQEELEKRSNSLFRNAILKYTHQVFFKMTMDVFVIEKKAEIEAEKDEKKKKEKQIELMEAQNRFRRRKFGNITFIGQLYLQNLVNLKVIKFCIVDLLKRKKGEPIDEESIDCAVRLMETIGKRLNEDLVASQNAAAAAAKGGKRSPFARKWQKPQFPMDRIFQKLDHIQSQVSRRINLMILNLVELRENNWIPRTTVGYGPKKMNEIEKEMKKEQLTEEQQKIMQRQLWRNGRGKQERRGKGGKVTSNENIELHKAKNPWKAENLEDLEGEEAKEKKLLRDVRGLLNKITPTTKDALIDEFLSYKVYETPSIDEVINLIFNMAVERPKSNPLYSSLCISQVQEELEKTSSSLFRYSILKYTHQIFFNKTLDDLVIEKKAEIEAEEDEKKKKEKQIELMEIPNQFRRRKFGNITFIGQLYLHNLLNFNIIHFCIVDLLQRKDGEPIDEESIECVVRLMETVGKRLNDDLVASQNAAAAAAKSGTGGPPVRKWQKSQSPMDEMFQTLDHIQSQVSRRINLMILNLVELRENNWIPRMTVDDGPTKLNEIKEEMEKKRLAKEQKMMLRQLRRNGRGTEERTGRGGKVTGGMSKNEQKQSHKQSTLTFYSSKLNTGGYKQQQKQPPEGTALKQAPPPMQQKQQQ